MIERAAVHAHAESAYAPERGLYVHIPFCVKKCYYCDFNSYALDRAAVEAFLRALEAEARLYRQRFEDPTGPDSSSPVFDTLFIGGGTPTCLSGKDLARLVGMLFATFDFRPGAEVTCEANPGSSNEEKYEALRAAGVNRLSIGVQSLDDGLLRRIGRMHTAAEALRSIAAARRAGFDNLNVDLMFALPGQTRAQWQSTLEGILEQGPEHLSCYSLIIEEGTPFGEAHARGILALPGEDAESDMYEWAIAALREAGYEHYEISNFARPGRASRHNRIYWRVDPYLGLGPGAHSYWDGVRSSNVRLPGEYARILERGELPVAERRAIDADEALDDTMIFGLRMLSGVEKARVRARFGVEIDEVYRREIEELLRLGLIEVTPERVKLSAKGLPVANHVFRTFLRSP